MVEVALTPGSNLAQSEWMENYRLGTAQMPIRTCCPFQAFPLHSQWHPGAPWSTIKHWSTAL